MGSESFFCFIGGLFPIMATSISRKMGLFSTVAEEFPYPPIQLIFSSPKMSIVGLLISCVFFFCNYQVSFGLKYVFEEAKMKPNKTYKKILNYLCNASSFSLVAFSLLDFKHFTTTNNIAFGAFFVLLMLFYYAVDLVGIACDKPNNSYHIAFDMFLTLMIFVYFAYFNNALQSTDLRIFNTSSVLGYLTTGLAFFRYFLVGFQI